MCRNIKTLYHLDPPASQEEVHDAAVQFVRKVSGYRKPSRANEEAFNIAVDDIARAVQTLLDSLQTNAPLRERQMPAHRSMRRNL